MTTTPRKVPGTKFSYKDGPPNSASRSVSGQYGDIKLFAGSGSHELGQQVAEYLGVSLSEQELHRFSNENIFVRLKKSVRGQDVYLIQGMGSPVSDNILEMLITLNTLKLDSAGRITAVIPYFGYGRSDKKDQPRVGIAARLMADIIQVSGADRYMTIDLHAGQIQGFFSIPGDVLGAFHLISDFFIDKQLKNAVIVSTDLGFAKTARNYAAKMDDIPLAVVEKRRRGNRDQAEVMNLLNAEVVPGMDAIIVDEECNTAGSLVNAVQTVKAHGARDIYVAFTHAVLSGPAVERLQSLPIREIVTTNTLPIPAKTRESLPNMTVLSIAPLLGEVIMRAHQGRSVGELFDE